MRKRRAVWAGGIGALVALFVLTVWIWRQPVTVVAPLGTTLTTTLPDGSRAELNSGARLSFHRTFTEHARSVHLTGEAFFAVQPDARPFLVETFNARVQVLGTRFNVRAWPEDAQHETLVAVEHGRVQVQPLQDSTTVVLSPGQRSTVRTTSTTFITPPSPTANPAPWRTGSFVFYDASFDRIFAEIERRFDVSITASETLRSRTWGFVMHDASSADSLLNNLCLAAGLRYRPTANGYEVYTP
jgi:ferric-dicitrate binding protein FerR (iron transport regulator)